MTKQPPAVALSNDLTTHLAKKWPIQCVGFNVLIIKEKDEIQISDAGTDLVLSIVNGPVVSNWQPAETRRGVRMRTIDDTLNCAIHARALRNAAAAKDRNEAFVDPDDHLPQGLRFYEHAIFSVTVDGADYYIFAFVCIPNDADASQDTLLLEIHLLKDGRGVTENSVHGGPPT